MRKILLSLVITFSLVLGAVFPLLTTNKITAQAEVSSLVSLPYQSDIILNSKEFRLVKDGDNLSDKQIFIVVECLGEMVGGLTVVCGNDVIFASNEYLYVGTKSDANIKNEELSKDDISIVQESFLAIGNKVYRTKLDNNTNCVDFARAETGVKGNNYIGVYVFDPEGCGLEERELQVGDKLPSNIVRLKSCDSLNDTVEINGFKININGSFMDCSMNFSCLNGILVAQRIRYDNASYNVYDSINGIFIDDAGGHYVVLAKGFSFKVVDFYSEQLDVMVGENFTLSEINGEAGAFAYFDPNAPEEPEDPAPGESEEEQESEELKPGESEEEQESEELKPGESEEEQESEELKPGESEVEQESENFKDTVAEWMGKNLGITVTGTGALVIIAVLIFLLFKK